MPFSPLTDVNGRPTLRACLEQINLMLSCWVGQQSDTEALLNLVGGGNVLLWSQDLTRLPPIYVMVQQGTSYYLSFGGTDSVLHWVCNVLGAALVSSYGGLVLVQGLWQDSWVMVRGSVLRERPEGTLPGCNCVLFHVRPAKALDERIRRSKT
jgi:hypothetical protein